MDLLAILLYLIITSYITIYVGRVLFTNGRHFLLRMLMNEGALTDSVNKILLTGYYLVNLGYVGIMLTAREPVSTMSDLVASLSTSIGTILLTLGVMHFINITVAIVWHKINSQNNRINL